MDETEIDLHKILGLLRRRIRLILATMAVVVGVAVVALFALTPQYTSTALILVDTSVKDLLDPSSVGTSTATDSARVDSEVEILKSNNVLMSVIASENLVTDEEFGVALDLQDRLLAFFRISDATLPTGEQALQSVLGRLKPATSIQRNGLTYLISVSFTSGSPAKAAHLANAIATKYIESQVLAKVNSIELARNTLQARASTAGQLIVQSEKSFDKFISDNIDVITLETGRADIAEMRNELLRLEAERARSAGTASAAAKQLQLRDWVSLSQSLGDQAIEALNRQRGEIANRLTTASESSLAINLRAELATIESELSEAAQKGVSKLNALVRTAQNNTNAIKQQLRTSVLNSDLPPDVLTRIFALQQNAEIARTEYQHLLARVSNLEARAQTQLADSRIVSKALSAGEPSFPNTQLILALALIASTGLGVGLAFLYENFIGGFSNTEQVQSVLRIPGGLSVPHVVPNPKSRKESKAVGTADLMVVSPMSAYAESIRRIRLASERMVEDRAGAADQKSGAVILVTSAVPGEGKSTISLSLARAFAQSGKTSLLIDCDLRKPSLHKYLDAESEVGLADYLSHPDEPGLINKIIVSDKETPLAAIVGSGRADVPTDQLSGGASLSRLIDIARSRSEFVILDSPPLLPVIDGLYLAEHADAIALVVRWASTSQKEARDALSAVMDVKKSTAGVFSVLNQQEGGMRGYQYRYSGHYDR